MAYDTTRLANLGAERARLVADLDALMPRLHEEMLAAHAAGIGTVEVARHAHVTRDAVRQLVNKRAAQG